MRQQLKLSQSELSSRLQMPQSTYAGYETGKRKITLELIQQFSQFFEVSPTFLVTGNDSVSSNVSSKEKEHIKKYRALDERGRIAVDAVLDTQYDAVKPKSQDEEEIS